MFEVLKKQLTMEPILVVPDLDKRMRMEVDILDYAIEEVLLVEYSNI